MRKLLLATTFVVAITPAAVMASEFSITAGATLTSRYMSNGLAVSKGVAFQPYVEAEVSGFYAGLWASNIGDPAIADYEIDVYFGYRNEIGNFSYDVGYARYFLRDPNSASGEFILSAGVQVTDAAAVSGQVKYEPDNKIFNISATGSMSVTDAVSVDMTIGGVSNAGGRYGILGVNYSVTPDLTATLAYHDSTIGKGRAVLSLDYNFSIR
jgi:uncharacterized protein (TIGR02001 family)